jgi:hypothetical protein
VVEELVAYAEGVKYLITSQINDVWVGAEIIELQRTTKTQGRKIVANDTQGLPKQGELPAHLWVSHIHFHPISMLKLRRG